MLWDKSNNGDDAAAVVSNALLQSKPVHCSIFQSLQCKRSNTSIAPLGITPKKREQEAALSWGIYLVESFPCAHAQQQHRSSLIRYHTTHTLFRWKQLVESSTRARAQQQHRLSLDTAPHHSTHPVNAGKIELIDFRTGL